MEMCYVATSRLRQRLYGALIALAIVGTGVVVHPSTAAASVSYPFSGPTVSSGTATFVNSYTVTITASVWGDYDGPGYIAYGDYFGGVGRYRCVSATHRNYAVARLRTYTDTLVCPYANIQQVEIIYLDYGFEYVDYINNPYA
jgi:hypothetical protein